MALIIQSEVAGRRGAIPPLPTNTTIYGGRGVTSQHSGL